MLTRSGYRYINHCSEFLKLMFGAFSLAPEQAGGLRVVCICVYVVDYRIIPHNVHFLFELRLLTLKKRNLEVALNFSK